MTKAKWTFPRNPATAGLFGAAALPYAPAKEMERT